jgi:hypothetical protein
MITQEVTVKLKPVVRFREFPFGTSNDPSMREFMAPDMWQNQDKAVEYLKSGLVLAYPVGADLIDWFDRPMRANPLINGKQLGGTTPLTDGTWFWHAGLIHFIEKYNVRLPQEFLEYAGQHAWRVEQDAVPRCRYDFSYFSPSSA